MIFRLGIKRSGAVAAISYIAILVICVLASYIPRDNDIYVLKNIGVLCVLEFLLFFFINGAHKGKYLTFSFVLVSVLFIFNFGQLIILTFFSEVYSHVRFLRLMSETEAVYGFRMINFAFVMVCLGVIIGEIPQIPEDQLHLYDQTGQGIDWLKIAKAIIISTFPVKFSLDIATLYISITQGGTVARYWVNSFPNVVLYYGKISLLGIALLLVCLKTARKKQQLLFLVSEGYILIMMVSGIRSENVSYLLVLAFIYFACNTKKINIVDGVLCIVLGVFVLTFIVAAGAFRAEQDKSLSAFADLFILYLTKRNVLLYLLDTLGDTGYTALCVISRWLTQFHPSGGKSYYLGCSAVIPSVFGYTGQLTRESCFALQLSADGVLSQKYLNIGGSLIGEQFFNFGVTGGPIACLIIGMVVGWTSRWFSYSDSVN